MKKNNKNILNKNIIFYQVWVNQFLSFYQKNLKTVKYDNIKAFLDKLESDGKEDWQIRQAYRSIKFFLEDFMCLTIDFSENPEDEFSDKPVKNPATWKDAFTEKTYRSWIRRFVLKNLEGKVISPLEKLQTA